MWKSDKWKEYELLDTSDGERLERWGSCTLVRPDPQVVWKNCRKIPCGIRLTVYTKGRLQAGADGKAVADLKKNGIFHTILKSVKSSHL